MAKAEGQQGSSSFSHYDDIRSEVQEMVDRLCELHDETDPRKGEASEQGKHEKAQRAVAIWWYVYARLMQWVQSHLIGYEMARTNQKLQDVLAPFRSDSLSENAHQLEQLGTLYVANPGYVYTSGGGDNLSDDHWSELLGQRLAEADLGLDDETLRRVIVQLLLSTSADSSVWRFPLSGALRALNHGEIAEFIKPTNGRRRGRSYLLDSARSDA
ncbi:MAG: hypothetical protein ABL962_22390, partial [Fimbriimonadaceae bacterium]